MDHPVHHEDQEDDQTQSPSQQEASALQAEELVNSLLLQGAFGPPATATTSVAAASVTASPIKEEERKETETTFFNHGLALWEEKRQEWLHTTTAGVQSRHAIDLDVDEVIDALFASSRPNATPKYFSVPLPQMIDILQDLWEAEGLDT